MRLFEAIPEANQHALAGDTNAGLHPGDFADELPVVALTCIGPRFNPLIPKVLGGPEEQFIWLCNAGNIITGSASSRWILTPSNSKGLAIVANSPQLEAALPHQCRFSIPWNSTGLKVRADVSVSN